MMNDWYEEYKILSIKYHAAMRFIDAVRIHSDDYDKFCDCNYELGVSFSHSDDCMTMKFRHDEDGI